MQVEQESDGEQGDGMKLCFLRAYSAARRGAAARQGPGILLALRSEYETKKKRGRGGGERKKESGGREAGEGPRVRSLFRSFINPPP